MKQDRTVVRRAEELERKYKLGAIGDTAKEIARHKQVLQGLDSSMQQQGQTMGQRISNLEKNKLSNSGWGSDKYLGTDEEGNVVELDKPSSSAISLLDVYPVGSIYMSVNEMDPATLFGGTWERFANGRVLVGVDENDADFLETQKTGGEKNNTHNHATNFSFDGTTFFAMKSNQNNVSTIEESVIRGVINPTSVATDTTRRDSTWSTEISILQPYVTCYIWLRTA